MVPVVVKHDLHYFWQDSIKYQSDRVTPFSIYGLWGGLSFLQHLLQGAAVALAVVVALLPGRRWDDAGRRVRRGGADRPAADGQLLAVPSSSGSSRW